MKKSKVKFLEFNKSIVADLTTKNLKGGWIGDYTYLAPCGYSGECTSGAHCLKVCVEYP